MQQLRSDHFRNLHKWVNIVAAVKLYSRLSIFYELMFVELNSRMFWQFGKRAPLQQKQNDKQLNKVEVLKY